MQPASLQIEPAADPATALNALLHSVGRYALADVRWVRVSGGDRLRWMSGMVTNAIQTLVAGEGCYNYLLSAQGHIEGDATVFNAGETLLMQTAAAQREHIISWLDHYIIMDDVELTPDDSLAGIGIAGPQAAALLGNIFPGIALPQPLGITTAAWQGAEVRIIAAYSPLVPRYELWLAPEQLPALQQALQPAVVCNAEAMEWLRLLEGTPLYGTDIRNTAAQHELPQETALVGTQSRALHFAKGCYLGQEIVERIRSRGNVHRTLAGFLISGDVPAAGSAITAEEKVVGEITSAARIPLAEKNITLALGYIRREALERKLELSCNGNMATQVSLPYGGL